MRRARSFKVILSTALIAGVTGCDTGRNSDAPLDPPQLIGPSEEAQFPARSLVEFSWSRVLGATAYEYDIDYDDYPNSSTSGIVLDTFHVEHLAELGPVRWRVRGHTADGAGPWSGQRYLDVRGTEILLTTTIGFAISTQEAVVGDRIRTAAGESFSAPIASAIQSEGGDVSELRDVRVTRFQARISSSAETTFAEFSEWRLFLVRGSAEDAIADITDPAPAFDATTLVFQRPEAWMSLVVNAETQLELSVLVNPRSPRATDVQVDVEIDMIAVLNR